MNCAEFEFFCRSSAGTLATPGRCRLAQDHSFIAYWCVPSQPQGTTKAPLDDAFTLVPWVVVVAGGPVGRTRFGLLSLQSPPLPLTLSCQSRTCVRVGPPATE